MQAKVRRLAITLLLLSAILLATVAPATGRAAQDPPADPMLFTPAPGGTAAPEGPADPRALRQRWVQVDQALLAGSRPGDRLGLNLFEDALYAGVVDHVTRNPSGSVSWTGYLEGEPFSQFVLVLGRGQVAGSITRLGAIYQVRPAAGDLYGIHQVDLDQIPPEGGPIVPTLPRAATPAEPGAPADDGSAIDVLVVYTPDARDAAGGTTAILNFIDLAITETNRSYANSGVTQRLRLVNAAELPYNETGFLSTDLQRLTWNPDGYLDEAHELRDLFGADCVSLLVENTQSSAGIAYLMTEVRSDFAAFAFSVVVRQYAVGNMSFAHELGHNMSAHHDWYVNTSVRPFAYNHGYVDVPQRFRTIMSYFHECSDQGAVLHPGSLLVQSGRQL